MEYRDEIDFSLLKSVLKCIAGILILKIRATHSAYKQRSNITLQLLVGEAESP